VKDLYIPVSLGVALGERRQDQEVRTETDGRYCIYE
jgi:hypothetical protein